MIENLDFKEDDFLCKAEVSIDNNWKKNNFNEVTVDINIIQAVGDDEINIILPDGKTLTFKHTEADTSDDDSTVTIKTEVLQFLLERCVLFGQTGK